jgi:hypothetical protein
MFHGHRNIHGNPDDVRFQNTLVGSNIDGVNTRLNPVLIYGEFNEHAIANFHANLLSYFEAINANIGAGGRETVLIPTGEYEEVFVGYENVFLRYEDVIVGERTEWVERVIEMPVNPEPAEFDPGGIDKRRSVMREVWPE